MTDEEPVSKDEALGLIAALREAINDAKKQEQEPTDDGVVVPIRRDLL